MQPFHITQTLNPGYTPYELIFGKIARLPFSGIIYEKEKKKKYNDYFH